MDNNTINTLIVTLEFIIFYLLINRKISKAVDKKLTEKKDDIVTECIKRITEDGKTKATNVQPNKTESVGI